MAQRNTPRAAAVYGIDIGKNIFHVVGLGGDGAVIQKVRFRRDTLLQFFERAAPAIVGMESFACHGQIETATECWYRWVRLPDLNLSINGLVIAVDRLARVQIAGQRNNG
ncbi:hypothetical protein [Bradyrhizobium sp. STM 3843]|uniref:hypothetical protein n=1 Tax=Bradyrhizobium sp. STM 3843 TaxID=551947 RepID=UPI00055DFE28|nr:hypothetical protein [Bradyrhizobium sp. STM 3843]